MRPDAFIFFRFFLAYLRLLDRTYEAQELHLAAPQLELLSWFEDRGISDNLLQWMIFRGHIEHFRQSSNASNSIAVHANSLIIRPDSAFALTASGVAQANHILDCVFQGSDDARARALDSLLLVDLVPHFAADDRTFSWGQHLLKQFDQRPGTQELILTAEEELQWPEMMDDPLPRKRGLPAKRRLHNTINDLNRRQNRPFIHFRGNGSGTGIGWELS